MSNTENINEKESRQAILRALLECSYKLQICREKKREICTSIDKTIKELEKEWRGLKEKIVL